MKNFIYLFLVVITLTSCNDGDVLEVALDFDNTFQTCGELVFYKTKTDPAESLSIFIANKTINSVVEYKFTGEDSVFVELVSPMTMVNLDGVSNKFNYRTYSSLPSQPFCSDVPSSELNITSDAAGTANALITTTLIEDDNDGIPRELEDRNGNGNLNDDDTDGDGIPDYLDADDDGDNVPTILENPNYTEADGLANAQNTDALLPGGDTKPDYLDNDDDGDGIPTRDEENITQDNDPTNDITDPTTDPETGQSKPDYLNNQVATSVPATGYRLHVIKQTFEVQIDLTNISIPKLQQDFLNFGKLVAPTITSKTRNPKTIFN